MKINDSNIPANVAPASAQEVGAPHSDRARSGGVSARGTDEVELSGLSSRLAALQSNSPERSANLDRLAAAVSNGQYRIDPQAVGGAIINESLRV
jgi:flagellar biosynthesis anti-sigma factor FlgM